MEINEERLVEKMWVKFSIGKIVTNSVCSDFFFTMIRPQRSLSHLNAFEVLDTIVNCPLPADHSERKQSKNQSLPTAEVAVTREESV